MEQSSKQKHTDPIIYIEVPVAVCGNMFHNIYIEEMRNIAEVPMSVLLTEWVEV